MSEMNSYQKGEVAYALYSQYLKKLTFLKKESDAKDDHDIREAYRACNKLVCAKMKTHFYNKESVILKKHDLCKQV